MKTRIYQNPIKKTEENENSATLFRVLRGGSWRYVTRNTQVSYRYYDRRGFERYYLGFRIVRNQK